jgi:hypothetical protein
MGRQIVDGRGHGPCVLDAADRGLAQPSDSSHVALADAGAKSCVTELSPKLAE